MPKAALGVLVALALGATVGTAFAQGTPSADSIINSLTPVTRGIRAMNSSESVSIPQGRITARIGMLTTVPGTPLSSPAPNEASGPSVNLTVQFATNSAELTPAAVRTLDELGRALSSQSLSPYHFRIEGHTDTVGSADRNQALSEARANKVVDYLAAKFHVDPARLEPVGMGDSHPLVQTGANVAEPRNRRVMVVNVGA